MELENIVVKLISTKNYDFELCEAIKELLPEMVDIFGKEKTIKFFEEYTLVPRNRTGLNNSGATYKDQKMIEFDWSSKDRHEAINALIHEAGHALGALETEQNHILMEGFQYREAFLTKLEEAVVSEKQDELEFGEIGYNYVIINNPETGEDFHRNDFKTQSSHKYTINKVFHQNIMMLLGENRVLINKLMYEDSLDNKKNILEKIIKQLKNILTPEEFVLLHDCATVFVLNYSYRGDKTTVVDYLKDKTNFDEKYSKEDHKRRLIQIFPKNLRYAVERHLLDKNIFTAIDDLCEISLNVIIRNFNVNKQNSFENIKVASEYFSKVYNTSDQNREQTELLKKLFIENIAKINGNIYRDFMESGYTSDDFIDIFSKIIATHNFKEDDLNKMIYDKTEGKIFIDESISFAINKNLVYSDDDYAFGFLDEDAEPIGYDLILSKIGDDETVNKKR